MQSDARKSKGVSTIALTCLIAGPITLLVSGGFLWAAVVDYNNVASTPITPISALKDHVGTEKPVRVQVTAIGEPPLTTPGGEELAFEYVEVTHDQKLSGRSRETIVDYKGWAPESFWVSDGKDKIRVIPESITQDNLHVRGRVDISSKKVVDPSLAPVVVQVIHDAIKLNEHRSEHIKVCTIPKGAELTIVAAVGKEGDELVLQKAPGKGLWVSVKPPTEVATNAQRSMIISGIVAAIALVITIFGVISLRKKE